MNQEIKQVEGITSSVKMKNARLVKTFGYPTLDHSKTVVHQKNVEPNDNVKEVKDLSRSFRASPDSA